MASSLKSKGINLMWNLIYEEKFLQTAAITFSFVLIINILFNLMKKKSVAFKAGAASTLSWLFIIPLIFVLAGTAWPYPLAILCVVSVYGAKNFFQMTGMYHRSNFVYACYFAIMFSTYCIYKNYIDLFNLMPMILFFVVCLIPLLRNSYKHMVQYMALTILNFCFLWAFIHMGWIMKMPGGVYTFLYIVMLTEFFDTLYLGISKYLKYVKLISNITPKRSLDGFVLAGIVTLFLGWGMRHLLPVRTELYWVSVSLTCILFGSTGDSVLTVVRRDLGIKVTDSFILGRGDFFSRLDRLVFVAPIAHYVLFILGTL
jgi:phosphatidate cytidylyltransferase